MMSGQGVLGAGIPQLHGGSGPGPQVPTPFLAVPQRNAELTWT